MKALQGDGSHFEMETVGTTSKMGNLTVVEPLDFENEVFYLLEITVTVLLAQSFDSFVIIEYFDCRIEKRMV